MSSATQRRFPGTLPGPWLAARMGTDPVAIEAMRRAGELIAVRETGSTEWLYPAWQFDGKRPRRDIVRISAEARDAGLDETRLYDLLMAPMGLAGSDRRTLVDLVLEGRTDEVVASIRAAG